MQKQIDELKSGQIASLSTQISGISVSLANLQTVDNELRGYIKTLQDQKIVLEEADKTIKASIEALKKELSDDITAAEANALAQLEAYKSNVASQLQTINSTIASLQQKDSDLQSQITTLTAYVNNDLKALIESGDNGVKTWASATFVTLEQYNTTADLLASIQGQIEAMNQQISEIEPTASGISQSDLQQAINTLDQSLQALIQEAINGSTTAISTAKSEITTAYTTAITDALSSCENSMKTWVNNQLSGYYTIAQTDAKLTALKTSLEGQLNSQKTYLGGLINTLEATLNTKINNNKVLIEDLSAEQTSQAADIAANASAISKNAQDILVNANAITQNAADIDACKKLIAANKNLIDANQQALSALISTNAGAIAKNAQDIATNASLISANAAAIAGNTLAISNNAADIVQLKEDLATAKTAITSAYTAAINSAITTLDGKLSGKIAEEVSTINARIDNEVSTINAALDALTARVATCEKDIKNIKNTIYGIQQDIEHIQEQITAILARIQSITYVPKYADGKAVMTFTNNGTITPGVATFDFELKPATTAADLVPVWQEALSMRAVYTITKAAPETVNLNIENVSADNGFLTVTVSGKALSDAYFLNQRSANVRLSISDGNNDLTTDYIQMIPWTTDVISFADANFKAYCVENFDKDGDNEISENEAKMVTDINASMLNISSLVGIEYFSALKTIDVSYNKLESLDLTHSPALTDINVAGNKIQNLAIDGLASIKTLDVSNNKLGTLNVSEASQLLTLDCSHNQLGALTLNNNKVLTELNCSYNNIAVLDLKNNTSLQRILCRKNSIGTIDVSKHPALTDLDVSYNNFTSLNVYNNAALETLYCAANSLNALGVSANAALTVLDCSGNGLSALDVTRNPALETLNCSENNLSSLDVSRNSALESVNCQSNASLEKLWVKDAAQQAALTIKKDNTTNIFFNNGGISIPDANLKAYLVANYDDDGDGEISPLESENVTLVNCSNKSISDLTGLEACTNLTYVNCAGNTIGEIDFHTLTKLETLICYGNPLTVINLNNCNALKSFKIIDVNTEAVTTVDYTKCINIVGYEGSTSLKFSLNNTDQLNGIFITGSSTLETLDLSDNCVMYVRAFQNTALTSLLVHDNVVTINANGCPALEGIDVSRCTKLERLVMYDCALTSLDVTGCPALYELRVNNNNIPSVDLSNNPLLKTVEINNNNLTAINVSNNAVLEKLDVSANNLPSINVRNNPALTYLDVSNNSEITVVNVSKNPLLGNLDISATSVSALDVTSQTGTIKFAGLKMAMPIVLTYLPDQAVIPEIGTQLLFDGTQGIVYNNKIGNVGIISLDETSSSWSTEQYNFGSYTHVSMSSVISRGIEKYPAFKWCYEHGDKWYLPNRDVEMEAIYKNKTILNTVLSDLGATLLSGQYWTCTNYNTGSAEYTDLNNTNSTHTNYSTKTQSKKVRAVRLL